MSKSRVTSLLNLFPRYGVCNVPDKDGKPHLWFAVQSGQAEACGFLITQEADMEAKNPSTSKSVQRGHADIVALLWPR